jgi:hypothetical protein
MRDGRRYRDRHATALPASFIDDALDYGHRV